MTREERIESLANIRTQLTIIKLTVEEQPALAEVILPAITEIRKEVEAWMA